jgi:tetratricopeptide (TPR) repeat protein
VSNRLATREDLFDVMEQIAEERIAARPLVQNLLSRGDEVWDEEIPESWRTAGFVQEVTAAADGILETDPSRSLSFAQLALAAASSIPSKTYPPPVQPFIEGRALKQIATAHRYLDKYDAALRGFDAALRAFARERALVHETARGEFGRATVSVISHHDNDVGELLERAAKVFRSFGDEKSVAHCEIVRAFITYRKGDLQAALMKHLDILRRFGDIADPYTLGALCNNVGHFYALLGNTAEAVSALQRGRDIFTELGMPSEVDRADWGLARALLTSGNIEEALPLLYRLRDAYLSRRMPDDAGLIGLHIVDALVALGRRDEALLLTEQVHTEFVNANLNHDAITALAYLRDLLPTSSKPRHVVNHVRSYVERSRKEPARMFIPLDPEA